MFMGNILLKKTLLLGFCCLCSFVKLYSCKEFSFFCKLILEYAVNEALPSERVKLTRPAVSLVV